MQKLDFRSDGLSKGRPRDVITAEEQAAIDGFPESKVQRIPAGVRGIDESGPGKPKRVWCEHYRRIERRGAKFRNAALNAEIRKLAMQGLSDQQIADEVGMSQSGIHHRRKRYGIPSGRDVMDSMMNGAV